MKSYNFRPNLTFSLTSYEKLISIKVVGFTTYYNVNEFETSKFNSVGVMNRVLKCGPKRQKSTRVNNRSIVTL